MKADIRKAEYENDLEVVYKIFSNLKTYSKNVVGKIDPISAAEEFFFDTPPLLELRKKHVFIISINGTPTGLIDLLEDFPEGNVCYVGLFAIQEQDQSIGVGRMAFSMLEELCKNSMNANKLRLGVKKTNPVKGFWEKMGFTLTKELSDAFIMEKLI
jgi:ribosomal protein S18 acetylase RimI-like enzyme